MQSSAYQLENIQQLIRKDSRHLQGQKPEKYNIESFSPEFLKGNN